MSTIMNAENSGSRKRNPRTRGELSITLTGTGVAYNLQEPAAPGEDYVAKLIAKPGDGEDAKYSEWKAPAPHLIDNDM